MADETTDQKPTISGDSPIAPKEAGAVVDVLQQAIVRGRDIRPEKVAATSMGEQTIVAMYERAFGLARAIQALIEGGLADEAAPQLRLLLEVAVVLGHAAETGQSLDHLALAIAHESVQQEKKEAIGPGVEEHRRRLEEELRAIQDEASRRQVSVRSSNLDVEVLAGKIGRYDQVALVYRRTSGLLHLTRSSLSARIVDDGARFVIMLTSSLWAEAATAELAARNFTAAIYSAAYLLKWETGTLHEELMQETEQRLEELIGPVLGRRRRSD